MYVFVDYFKAEKMCILYIFIAMTPRSTVARVVVPDRVRYMGQIELFDI